MGALQWIKDQKTVLPMTKADLAGKTVIITGANAGIGFETAKHMASMNPGLLILACRNETKGEAACQEISKATGCDKVVFRPLDLSSFESVKQFATRFESEGHSLDLLVENAGVSKAKFEKTPDGWETTLQTNYLSHVLLTLRLLPFMSRDAERDPRIVVVASDGHNLIKKIPKKATASPNILEKLSDPAYGSGRIAGGNIYGTTKLFNILFARHLASSLPSSSPITVNSVNPGLCLSTITNERNDTFALEGAIIGFAQRRYGRTNEMGSRTLLDAALSSDKGKPAHGRYIGVCRVKNESRYARSEAGKQLEVRLWKETMELLAKVDDRVPEILKTLE